MGTLFYSPATYDPASHKFYSFLPFTKLDRLPILRGAKNIRNVIGGEKTPMLYFLYKDAELVYIGRSINILKRLRDHRWLGKEFTGVRVIPYPEYEEVYIKVFKPELNKRSKTG